MAISLLVLGKITHLHIYMYHLYINLYHKAFFFISCPTIPDYKLEAGDKVRPSVPNTSWILEQKRIVFNVTLGQIHLFMLSSYRNVNSL